MLFYALMYFVSFGAIAVMFASIIGVAFWLLKKVWICG
jgi:hypothetical protein